MPSLVHLLNDDSASQLVIEWNNNFKEVTVKFNERLVGSVSGIGELRKKPVFTLDDGMRIKLGFGQGLARNYVQVWVNDQPLPEQVEAQRWNASGTMLVAVGIIGLMGSLANLLGRSEAGIIPLIGFGLCICFIALGILTLRRNRMAAMIGTGLYGLQFLFGIGFYLFVPAARQLISPIVFAGGICFNIILLFGIATVLMPVPPQPAKPSETPSN